MIQTEPPDPDDGILPFIAEHRVVTYEHIQALLHSGPAAAGAQLRMLHRLGYVDREQIFHGEPASCWITRAGLRAIGSSLPPPTLDLKGYRHDLGIAWLWLAAGDGAFGRLTARHSERAMRSLDRRAASTERPFGIGLGAVGPRGGRQLHYPDLVLDTAGGHRIAVELELTAKSERRLDQIMLGYATDARVGAVLYLCPPGRLPGRIEDAARRAGIAGLVHVQTLERGSPRGAPDPGRSRGRSTARARQPGVRER